MQQTLQLGGLFAELTEREKLGVLGGMVSPRDHLRAKQLYDVLHAIDSRPPHFMTNALPMLVGKQNGLLGLGTICPPKKLRTGKAKRRNYDLASYTCTDWSADIAFMSYEASVTPSNGKLYKTNVHEFVKGTTQKDQITTLSRCSPRFGPFGFHF